VDVASASPIRGGSASDLDQCALVVNSTPAVRQLFWTARIRPGDPDHLRLARVRIPWCFASRDISTKPPARILVRDDSISTPALPRARELPMTSVTWEFKKDLRGGGDSGGHGFHSVRPSLKAPRRRSKRADLDKLSPRSSMLGPGNYVVDITQTGFKGRP